MEMSDMTFGWLLAIVAGGLTLISLGIIILVTKVLKSFQKSETTQKAN
ncbi:MAG: OadG-related small transporter subunit [Desulfitobacteriaceae bacterium]|nr:OadG-related small transporter subunit [Desulfitobacteriaceae bacterium]MDD4347153.1 OadG-related small transporter subunit [Desulfitobacteriaceae bacterium]MDD4401563.1 OadG-related small transporter subunit [Desulfitobacteriaceae bacterium]